MNSMDLSISVYCGTYKKYNEGSLFGEWIQLSDFDDKDSFMEHCLELHKDEKDPELMFQDWESPFDGFISESHIDDLVFEIASEFKESEYDALSIFILNSSEQYTDIRKLRNDFDDAYIGKYESEEDFAEEMTQDQLDLIPESLRYYFDYTKYARDLFLDGYIYEGGYVFRF